MQLFEWKIFWKIPIKKNQTSRANVYGCKKEIDLLSSSHKPNFQKKNQNKKTPDKSIVIVIQVY